MNTLTPTALAYVLTLGRALRRARGEAHAAGWVQALLDGMQDGTFVALDGESVTGKGAVPTPVSVARPMKQERML